MEVLQAIAQAESQAEEIRREAAVKAREMIVSAQAEADAALKEAAVANRKALQEALGNGREQVRKELEAHAELRKRQGDDAESSKETRIRQAAAFLQRKVVSEVVHS